MTAAGGRSKPAAVLDQSGRSAQARVVAFHRLDVDRGVGGHIELLVALAAGRNTEMLALNSAVTYLQGRLGPRAEPEFDCDATAPLKYGPPVVIDEFRLSS